jgi:hypothetical protein
VVRAYRHFAEESVKRSLIFPRYQSRRGKDDHRGTGILSPYLPRLHVGPVLP